MSRIVGQPKTIKKINRDVIKNLIKDNGPISKPEIADITKLSLVTVNKVVEHLLNENMIKASGMSESTGGRRAQLFEYNGDLANIIALYYHNNSYLGAISNIIGEIKFTREFKLRTDDYENSIEDTCNAIDYLLSYSDNREIKAIGIGVPGVVKNGVISNIPNIPSWENLNLREILEDKYNCTVCIENDVNLTTIGIYEDIFKDKIKNMVLVYIGDGIGSGIIINEQLFKGATNFAGELSYLKTNKYYEANDEASKYKGSFEKDINELKNQIREKKDVSILKEALINTLVDGFINLLCILNPEVLIIQTDELSENDIDKIVTSIKDNISQENMPEIIKLNDEKIHSINGVVTLCLIETISSYSVFNRRGN